MFNDEFSLKTLYQSETVSLMLSVKELLELKYKILKGKKWCVDKEILGRKELPEHNELITQNIITSRCSHYGGISNNFSGMFVIYGGTIFVTLRCIKT